MPVRPPLTSTGALSALTGSLVLAGLLLGLPPQSPAQAPPAARPTPAARSTPAAPPPPGDGMVTIESDSQQADNRTGIVTATGNVRIQYPDRRMVATSRQAQYYAREGRLVLTGDVDVIDADGQRIRAEKLVYRLDSERLQAEPQPGRQVFSRLRLQSQPAPGAPAGLPLLPQPQPLRP